MAVHLERVGAVGLWTLTTDGPTRGRRVYKVKNRLCLPYLANLASLAAGLTAPFPATIMLGTGSSAGGPLPTDTALWTPSPGTSMALAGTSVFQTYYAQYIANWQVGGTATGTWTEAGMFDSAGNMGNHVVLNSINVQSDETFTVVVKVYMQGN